MPAPWVSCLNEDVLTRMVRVENLTGTPSLNKDDVEKIAFQNGNGCLNPVPATADRISTQRPEAKPSKAPTVDEVRALAQTFDDKLFEGDIKGAYEMLSCVNLYEKSMWGSLFPFRFIGCWSIYTW